MDTNVCFVFLLAIGLSAQKPSGQPVHKTEVEVDFYELVGKVKLQDGERTLLVSTTIHATILTLLKMFKNHTFLNNQII